MFLDLPEAPTYADPWNESFETRFGQLIARTRRIAYYYSAPDNSTFRYRCYNMIQTVAAISSDTSAAWFCAEDDARLTRLTDAVDVLVLVRVQYTRDVARLVDRARARGARILFDVDDLVYDPRHAELLMSSLNQSMGLDGPWDSWFAYLGRIGAAMRLCDGAITTNAFLAAQIKRDTGLPVAVVPNYLNREQLSISETVAAAKLQSGWRRDEKIHIGYFSGSPTHANDFAIVAPTLAALLDEDPRLTLRMVGMLEPHPALTRHADRVEMVPFCDFISLQCLIGATEINIAPLQSNLFTNSKSELKFFEAAAVATITIASPTDSYRRAIKDGCNGFLASEHEWGDRVRSAVSLLDAGDYPGMAQDACREAVDRYGWERQWPAIETAAFGPTDRRAREPRVSPSTGASVGRRSPSVPRREAILAMLEPSGIGLEVGPGYSPLLPKSEGFRVETADYTDRAGLLAKYAGNANVDVSRIETVDHVTHGRSLAEAVGRVAAYDFVVASHVIEHTPDLVAFLRDCATLLKPHGRLVLAVPDKRFCFDLLQPLTFVGDVLQAHDERRSRPSAGAVFNSIAYDVLRGGATGWGVEEEAPATFAGTLEAARAMAATLADDASYVDVHTWRFVPSSFRLVIEDLFQLGICPLREASFRHPNDGEFFVALSDEGSGPDIERNGLAGRIADEIASGRRLTPT